MQASFDGRTAIVGTPLHLKFSGRRKDSTYLLRGSPPEEVTRFDPVALVAGGARDLFTAYALDPDGRSLCVAHTAFEGADTRTRASLVDVASRRVTGLAVLDEGIPQCVRWVSSSRALVATHGNSDRTSLHAVDVERGAMRVAQLDALDRLPYDGGIVVHPDRDRVLLCVERAREPNRRSTDAVAMVCSLITPSAPEVVALASDEGPADSKRYGGACWDREGRLLTATTPRPSEAHLSRRDAVSDAPRAITHVPLAGALPHDLALSLSPRGALAVVTWRSLGRGDGDVVRRLALVVL